MRLWVDTNSASSVVDLRDLARMAQPKGVTVTVHPQVYLERRRQMQAWCTTQGRVFRPETFDGPLRQAKIEVFEFVFDQKTAARWADDLDRRYPSDASWRRAKLATIGGRVRDGFEVLPGDMPMTTDWWIALVVEGGPDDRIITADSGEEWRYLRESQPPRALSWADAVAWLSALPDVRE